MRKTSMFATAIAAALIATGFGVWATSPTNARVPLTGQGIDPHQMMMNASAMPATEFVAAGKVLGYSLPALIWSVVWAPEARSRVVAEFIPSVCTRYAR
jgi:hypothetical protein